jgi:hypothetical protein
MGNEIVLRLEEVGGRIRGQQAPAWQPKATQHGGLGHVWSCTRIWQLSADGEVQCGLVCARRCHVYVKAGARDEEVYAAGGERVTGDIAYLVQRRGKARLDH